MTSLPVPVAHTLKVELFSGRLYASYKCIYLMLRHNPTSDLWTFERWSISWRHKLSLKASTPRWLKHLAPQWLAMVILICFSQTVMHEIICASVRAAISRKTCNLISDGCAVSPLNFLSFAQQPSPGRSTISEDHALHLSSQDVALQHRPMSYPAFSLCPLIDRVTGARWGGDVTQALFE